MAVLDSFFRAACNFASPGGRHGRLTILFYHRVLPRPDPLLPDVPDAREFEMHMSVLSRVFRVLSIDEAIERLSLGTLPARSVCITFDDGYRDNFEVACPILKRHGLVATFFVASDFLDRGRMFNDTIIEAVRHLPSGIVDLSWAGLGKREVGCIASRIDLANAFVSAVKYLSIDERIETCARLQDVVATPLPDDLMMTSDQVRALAREGMSIGGHTCSHPILAKIPPEMAWREIVGNRDHLASLLDTPPRCFAYPNGRPGTDFLPEHVQMVQDAGYRSAVSTAWGVATETTDRFQLPRFAPWHHGASRLCVSLLRNAINTRVTTVAAAQRPPGSQGNAAY